MHPWEKACVAEEVPWILIVCGLLFTRSSTQSQSDDLSPSSSSLLARVWGVGVLKTETEVQDEQSHIAHHIPALQVSESGPQMKLHQMYRDSSCKRSSMLMLAVSFMGTMIKALHYCHGVSHQAIIVDGGRLEASQHPTLGKNVADGRWCMLLQLHLTTASLRICWCNQNACLSTRGQLCCFLWLLWRHVGKTRQSVCQIYMTEISCIYGWQLILLTGFQRLQWKKI